MWKRTRVFGPGNRVSDRDLWETGWRECTGSRKHTIPSECKPYTVQPRAMCVDCTAYMDDIQPGERAPLHIAKYLRDDEREPAQRSDGRYFYLLGIDL